MNKSVMKCCICNNENIGQFITINNKKYHLCCIEQLQQESKQLKDNWNKLREWIVYNKHNENTEQHYLVVDYGTLLGKMQEIEQGSDSNDSN